MIARAITFSCDGDVLLGVVHPAPSPTSGLGILMVVGGGPQYRVGGHRQSVLWSRALASRGYPVMRFDYRGMGDSHGAFRGFDDIDSDIRCAIDAFIAEEPSVREVLLWGECDAAAAILFYAFRDPRVRRLILLNPWARTEEGQARTLLRHYYFRRVLQRSFWSKVLRLEFSPWRALAGAASLARRSSPKSTNGQVGAREDNVALPSQEQLGLPERLLAGYQRFTGPILLIMSGRDMIAREFDDMLRGSAAWRRALASHSPTRHDIADADHTFSSAAQRDHVISVVFPWLASSAGS